MTICSTHSALPNGCPFVTLFRTALNCSVGSPSLTQSSQSVGRSIGHVCTGTDPRVPATAPAPLLRSFHEASPHRFSFHVTTDRQQILASFDGKGFEPPLIDVPVSYRVTMLMSPLRMSQREPVHEA